MLKDNNPIEILDHPPTPQELADIYMRSEENDPRSLLYNRVSVRPKIPVFKLLLYICLTAGFGVAGYIAAHNLWGKIWLAVICAVAAALLILLLLAKYILIAIVKTYQATAPTRVRNRCRYEPSCSAYMILAVEKYGFLKGFKKGLKRWKGCKPPNGGFDLP